ncbi:MAG: hypothetical protein WAW33_01025 [Minisyncoccia bacterium]
MMATKEKSTTEVKNPKTKILAGEPVAAKPKPIKKISPKKEK